MLKENENDDKEIKLISPYQSNNQNPNTYNDSGSVASSFFSVVFEIIKTIVIVGILALLLRIYIIQPFIVEGLSMSPTLFSNDYLLIDKISYRIGKPQRGDIIVFHYPKNTEFNYIKRIIGLPGETIEITEDYVILYHTKNPKGAILSEYYIKDPSGPMLNNKKIIKTTIPENYYFVMGDNRQGSSDSREWGLLEKKFIIGKSLVRLFPVNAFEIIKDPKYK